MDAYDFTVNQLRDLLRKFELGGSGTKAELIARLDAAFSREKWLAAMQKKMTEDAEDSANVAENAPLITPTSCPEVLSNNQTCPLQNESALLTRELEFMRRERELMQRELDLARRENELLRNTPRSEASARTSSNVTLKSICDYLCEFHGTEDTFVIWEREVKKLRTIYNLDDNSTKLLIGAKVKSRAAAWLHSKAEYIEMDADGLLAEMKKMFDHKLGKLIQKRKFEERKWKAGETYRGYHHDKIILGNQLSLGEDELVEYVIDGIPDARLRDQARMHRFSSLNTLFEAFENITLRADSKKLWTDASGKKNTSHFTKSRSETDRKETSNPQQAKCYNCNEEGHHSSSCPKPRREKGSCFHCGKMDHRVKDCPTKKEARQGSDKSKASTSNTKNNAIEDMSGTVSDTTALVEEPTKCQDIEGPSPVQEEIADRQAKEPLIEPTREYCVLLGKEFGNQYCIEALVDSGSAINIMSESTYLNFFSDEKLTQNEPNTNYGGINKSPLHVIGMITPRVRLHLIPNHVFSLTFVVVPNSTMTYDALLGRVFISTPGLSVTFGQSLQMTYNELVNEVLSIEAVEQTDPLDIVSNNLDASLSYEVRSKLFNLLNTYFHSTEATENIPYEFEIQLIHGSKPYYFT